MIEDKNKLIDELKKICSDECVLTSKEERYCYSFDSTNMSQVPELADVVVFPRTTQEVSKIMKLASKMSVPVVPRSAGTNLVGGCVPKQGGIVLHFSKMNKILEINKGNLYCKVEPGVVVADLQAKVEELGLFYPPDPSNLAVSMIGGSIALSSGGPRSFKYGTTKDYVIDLEVVLANGDIIHTGSSCAKNVTGYNLTQLFVGSEGTLGVITKATIRLIPKPESKRVLLSYFDRLEDASATVNSIISNLITPSVMDLIDKNTLATIEKFYPAGLITDKEAALLIEIDGFKNDIDTQYEQIISLCKSNNAAHIQIAATEEESAKIWTSRRSSFGATAKLAPNVLTEDVVVPRENIVPLVNGIKSICDKYSLQACIMGHIGDGNIHPNIALDLRNENERVNYSKAKKELFELALSLNGTLSGEHGIGCEKSMFLEDALSREVISYMKQIKSVFDPKNILNPGKIF